MVVDSLRLRETVGEESGVGEEFGDEEEAVLEVSVSSSAAFGRHRIATQSLGRSRTSRVNELVAEMNEWMGG
jgi:hypothetical protein